MLDKKINYLLPIKQVLLICGSYKTNENWNIIFKLLYLIWRYFNIIISLIGALQSFLYVTRMETFDMIDCTTPILNFALYLGMAVRAIYFATHATEAKELIRILNENFIYKINTPFGEKTMERYRKVTNGIVRFWQIYTPIAGCGYRVTGGNLPAKFYYPYNVYESPMWEITIVFQIVLQTMLGFIYSISDTFFVGLVLLTCGQLYLLRHKMKNIVYTALINSEVDQQKVIRFSNIFNKNFNENETLRGKEDETKLLSEMQVVLESEGFSKNFKKELVECVKMHRFLTEFIKHVEAFLSPCLLPLVFLTIFHLTFVSYGLLTSGTDYIVGFLSQIFGLLFQLSIYTYFGQKITNEYEKIYENLYESPWYLCNNSCKKMMVIVQINLLKPLTFSIGKMVTLNLPTLVNILRTFMSYLAVLQQLEN